MSMLFAHWCYFGAGILALVALREKDDVISTDQGNMKRMTVMAVSRATGPEFEAIS